MTNLIEHLAAEMAALRQAGTFKRELVLESPQGARVRVGGRDVVMLTSNNYLGFANHPRVREAQKKAVDRWGAGLASVRFICGTQALHLELEAEIASFFGKEDAILYMSCWNANEGLFAAVLGEPDGLYSDELNHASIIDGVRLCKATRFRVPHGDTKAFDAHARRGLDVAVSPDDDRRRLLHGGGGGGPDGARPHLRGARDAPRRGRLARDGSPRPDRARHGGGAGRPRPDPGLHRHARKGDGRRRPADS